MNTKEEKKLPFDYPDYPGSEVKLKRYGMEASYSRCYDGQRFIYSFHYNTTRYGKSRSEVNTSTKYNCRTSLQQAPKTSV